MAPMRSLARRDKTKRTAGEDGGARVRVIADDVKQRFGPIPRAADREFSV